MASLLSLTQSQPLRTLEPGEVLVREGEQRGALFVLETGRLVVERQGVKIADIKEPGAMIGEMSVLLGIEASATVRAERTTTIRVIDNAIDFLERTPLVALHVATLACARLDATSAILVELRKESDGKAGEQSLLNRVFSALLTPSPPKSGWAAHE
jgi:CRP/FNR family transcriptional regulator, cyclic AMP receptor protein